MKIFELIEREFGTYGLGGINIEPKDLLLIEDEVQSSVHNDTTEKQGGDGTNFYHLGQEDYDKVQDVLNPSTTLGWQLQTSATNRLWTDVVFGNGLYVAVSSGGDTNRVMTSPDGITWTSRVAFSHPWTAITYGNGLYVAVASGTGSQKIMTSPDGITWTLRTTPATSDIQFSDIAYGNNIFVTVIKSTAGNTNRVMTSPDGITWTLRAGVSRGWDKIISGAGLFIATTTDTGAPQLMTSSDGITWVSRSTTNERAWSGIGYGNGKYVIIDSTGGTSNLRIEYSSDGITWTVASISTNFALATITYGDGKFIALGALPNGDKSLVSYNAVDWVLETTLIPENWWQSVTYGDKFVAVGLDATSYSIGRVMTLEPEGFKLNHSSLNLDDGRNPHQTRYEDLLGTPPASGRNIDGGSASAVYLPSQNINGGTA